MTDGIGARKALIVASYEFEDPKLKELRAPVKDVEKLERVLSDSEIGAFEVETSLNEPDWTVRRRISQFFKDRGLDDVLLLHFSCHGLKDDDGTLYFATANTRFDDLDSTAIPADFVNRQMTRSRSRRVVLLLDCCYSGAFGRGMASRGDESVHVGESFEGRGRIVLTASNSMEYAFEGDDRTGEGRPSVFTSALVTGLESGEADRDRDSLISVGELYDYVYDRVRETTPNQTPSKWTYGEEGTFVIARSRFQPKPPPSPLPELLVAAVESPLAGVRQGAVSELVSLIGSSQPRVAEAARTALDRLAGDDSRRVSDAAKAALGRVVEPLAPAPGIFIPREPEAQPDPRPEPKPEQQPGPRGHRRRSWRTIAVGAAALAAAVAGTLLWLLWPKSNPSPPPPPAMTSIAWRASPGRGFGGAGHQEVVAIAPLGRNGAIAVGYSASASSSQPAVWRYGGRNWLREPALSSEAYAELEAVATHGSTVVAAGASGPAKYNTAAAVWTRVGDGAWQRRCPSNPGGACRATPAAQLPAEIWGLSSVPSGYVAVGRSASAGSRTADDLHPTVWISPDGLSWRTRYVGGDTGAMHAVARAARQLVAVGSVNRNGRSAMVWLGSSDGTRWHPVANENVELDLGNALNGVAARGSTIVAVGSRGIRQCKSQSTGAVAFRSTDGGRTWHFRASPSFRFPNENAIGVLAYRGSFVGFGYGHRGCNTDSFGAAWTSPDGLVWTLDQRATFFRRPGEVNNGGVVGGALLVGGDGSTAAHSPIGEYDANIWEGRARH